MEIAVELILGAFFGFACLVSLAVIGAQIWEEFRDRLGRIVHEVFTLLIRV